MEGNALRVFENRVFRSVIVTVGKKITGELRQLHVEKLYDL
jgi:hypothetical protein